MNLNNFTIKAQESVEKAFTIAGSHGQQAVECAHLLQGVMVEAESIVQMLFGKMHFRWNCLHLRINEMNLRQHG